MSAARAALAVLTAVTIVATSSYPSTAADTNHRYSVGADAGYPYQYTGVLVVRQNVPISVSPGSSCTNPFTVPVAYETQWVLSSDASAFVEIGTGYQNGGSCTYAYRFWQYKQAGAPITVVGIGATPPTGVNEQIDFYRLSAGGTPWWHWEIQGVEQCCAQAWNFAGYYVEAGLETYDGGAVAPAMTYGQLQETFAEGPWNWWTTNSRGATVTDAMMCGHFDSPYSGAGWVGSENSPC